MEIRTDLEFTVPNYSGGISRGLETLGEKRVITLENNKKVELLPYLLDDHYTRGTNKNDPRIRRNDRVAIPLLAQAYADHYNNAGINEHWTKEEAENMMWWHLGQSLGRLFFVKWARDLETNEEFPVGFFSAYSKPYQGGKILWDGELFVIPEYRKYGIGTELVEAVFQMAQASGINLFEALTYTGENGHPLKMWEKFGASITDLYHISGDVNEMLDNINNRKEGRNH